MDVFSGNSIYALLCLLKFIVKVRALWMFSGLTEEHCLIPDLKVTYNKIQIEQRGLYSVCYSILLAAGMLLSRLQEAIHMVS